MINNKLVSSFKMKVNHFDSFFASHYTLLDNNSKIPGSQTYMASTFYPFQFEESVILKIIREIHTYKVHGHDDISIKILKTFGNHFPLYLEIV